MSPATMPRRRRRHAPIRCGAILVSALLITGAAAAPPDAGEFTASRAIPSFPRPPGSPDPALRVDLRDGADAPALQARFTAPPAQVEPLYRRLPDGSHVAVTAPAWQALRTACPAPGAGDPRVRMIDLAAAEWAWFGLPVVDLSGGTAEAVPRGREPGDGFDIIAPARNFSIGPRVTRSAPRLGWMEDDAPVEATIAGYWAATPGGADVLRSQAIVDFGTRAAGWATPWSAAFVSWLACEAGLDGRFRRSGSHHDYVLAAVRARDGEDDRHYYLAYDLVEAIPAAGDLLCTARAGASFGSIDDVRAGTSDSNALHCDLVVKTDPTARRLYAIGGNVAQAVTLSVVATDPTGRPLPDAVLPGANRWFAVLKPRTNGPVAHDLDRTPTVLGLFQSYRAYAAAAGVPPPAPLPHPAAGPAAPSAADGPPDGTNPSAD
jgi:hypothetical protein